MHPTRMFTPVIAGVTLVSATLLAVRHESHSLRALVETEREFARQSRIDGFHSAMPSYFDYAGVFFDPSPKLARMEPPGQAFGEAAVYWRPEAAEVSAAGDLGYTVGIHQEVSADGGKLTRHGSYLSVWKREPRSPWKVALDFGVEASLDIDLGTRAFRGSAASGRSQNVAEAGYDELLSVEKEFAGMAKSSGYGQAVRAMASKDLRLHRQDSPPARNLEQSLSSLETAGRLMKWTIAGGEISASGDLGYTTGRYVLMDGRDIPLEGYFARVWRRNSEGRWKLVVDVANEASLDK